jgi:RNA polymerase sigma-70 factor (ECF subfamily)
MLANLAMLAQRDTLGGSATVQTLTERAGEREVSVRWSRPKTSAVGILTDTQLLKAIREGDESGLRAAVAKYGASVHSIASQILRQPMLAEEVAQDTFVMLWRKPESYSPSRGSLRAFLTAVARNKAIDVVRHEQTIREKESRAAEATRWHETAVRTDPSEGLDGLTIRAALNILPQLKKEALFLAYFRGLSYREVSKVLDIPEGTVKTRIRDALIRLRSSMPR